DPAYIIASARADTREEAISALASVKVSGVLVHSGDTPGDGGEWWRVRRVWYVPPEDLPQTYWGVLEQLKREVEA
ncbi:MAG: hypothetical protein JRI84_15440, partial [Deltaproteobacteria bacterium]|nr:hypothetical protein [Deltaproteobacteria bacterium]